MIGRLLLLWATVGLFAVAERKQKTWTRKAVEALGVRTDVPTAYEVITGRGRDAAYRAVKRGEFPVPVIHVGDRMIVPVQPILDLLGITPNKRSAEVAPPENEVDRGAVA
jgi:hypothetical protein